MYLGPTIVMVTSGGLGLESVADNLSLVYMPLDVTRLQL